MYCPKCEFEIQGNHVHACPVCSGGVVDLDEGSDDELTAHMAQVSQSELIDLEKVISEADIFNDELEIDDGPPASGGRGSLSIVVDEPALLNLDNMFDDLDYEIPRDAPKKSRKKRATLSLSLVLLLLLLGGTGYYAFQENRELLMKEFPRIVPTQKVLNLLGSLQQPAATTEAETPTPVFVLAEDETFVDEAVFILGPDEVFVDDTTPEPPPATKTKPARIAGAAPVKAVQKQPAQAAPARRQPLAAAAAKRSTSGRVYSIHVSSFRKPHIARAESDKLHKLGFKAYVEKTGAPDGTTWHRIKIGDFTSRREAVQMKNRLTALVAHSKPYILRKVPARQQTAQKKPVPEIEAPQAEKPVSVALAPVAPPEKVALKNPEPKPEPMAAPKPVPVKTQAAAEPEVLEQPAHEPAPEVETATAQEAVPANPELVPVASVDAAEKPAAVIMNKAETPATNPVPENQPAQAVAALPPQSEIAVQETPVQQSAPGPMEGNLPAAETGPQPAAPQEPLPPKAYTLTTGTYVTRVIAVNDTIMLKFLGYDDVSIEPLQQENGKEQYRVMLGSFASRSEAQLVQTNLAQGNPHIITSIVKLQTQ